MRYALYYLLAVNALGAAAVCLDKWKARHNKWRIPEKTLFLFALLGGCPGVYGAMRWRRHKTLHKRFMWGLPAIFVLQVLLTAAIYYLTTGKGLIV